MAQRNMNKADKAGMLLAFVVGPTLWLFSGDWRMAVVFGLLGVTLGVAWGTPGDKDRKQPVQDGPAKEECTVHCAGGCTYPMCLPGYHDQGKPDQGKPDQPGSPQPPAG